MKVIFISISLLLAGLDQRLQAHDVLYIPEQGLVPNADVAKEIGQAILMGVFGKKTIESERPLVAKLENDVWIVHGTMKDGRMGGVAFIHINKKDARILRLYHEQ